MIADEANMNREAVRWILAKELGVRKMCAQTVTRYLTEQQRGERLSVCADLLEQVEGNPELMDRVIIGEESWLIQYNPQTKHQSLEWRSEGSSRPKKARMSKLEVKYMLVCFFDSVGIVHKECVPAGQAVNQYYYTDILERLRKRVMRVRRNIAQKWIHHHDNAHAASLLTRPRTLLLLCISKSKIGSERKPF